MSSLAKGVQKSGEAARIGWCPPWRRCSLAGTARERAYRSAGQVLGSSCLSAEARVWEEPGVPRVSL